MRSLFSFPLCSSLQTTQTAVLQLRHRRDHASLLPCPSASPSGRVLIRSAPRARLRPRLLADRVADSLKYTWTFTTRVIERYKTSYTHSIGGHAWTVTLRGYPKPARIARQAR